MRLCGIALARCPPGLTSQQPAADRVQHQTVHTPVSSRPEAKPPGQFYLSRAWLLAIASQKPRRAAGLVGGDLYLFLVFLRPHLFHFPMPRGRPVLIKLIELLSFYSSALHLPRFKHFKMFLDTRKFKIPNILNCFQHSEPLISQTSGTSNGPPAH